jgi:hypothetical protein
LAATPVDTGEMPAPGTVGDLEAIHGAYEDGLLFTGDVYKCEFMPVEQGFYGDWTLDADELDTLQEIFPDGVCDYAQRDAGRPAGL